MKKLLAVILLCLIAGAVYSAPIAHHWSNVIIDNLVLPDNSIITPGMFIKRTGTSGTKLGLWDNCTTNEIPKWNGATWACAADAVNTGSNPVFDNVQSGTNTASVLTLGSGGTLTYSGTGVVNANQFKGEATPTGAEFGYLSGVTSAIQTQLGTKEVTANKSDNTSLGTSVTLYPTQNAVKSYVDGKFTDNTIDGAKVIDNTITNAKFIDNTIAVGRIGGSGTRDNTTFLRGDGAWSSVTDNDTFTATLTGCTTSPTGTVKYTKAGKAVTLSIPTVLGTSNTNAATLTGIPASITPSGSNYQDVIGIVQDNAVYTTSTIRVNNDFTLILFNGLSSTVFTTSGTKGITKQTITYYLE